MAGATVGTYIITRALKYNLPKRLVLRMMVNQAIDTCIGVIPFIGDLFDFGFKVSLMQPIITLLAVITGCQYFLSRLVRSDTRFSCMHMAQLSHLDSCDAAAHVYTCAAGQQPQLEAAPGAFGASQAGKESRHMLPVHAVLPGGCCADDLGGGRACGDRAGRPGGSGPAGVDLRHSGGWLSCGVQFFKLWACIQQRLCWAIWRHWAGWGKTYAPGRSGMTCTVL